MVGSNLPPGTTHRDIDRHFGDPETHCKVGEAVVDVQATEELDPAEALNISGSVVEDPVVHSEVVEVGENDVIIAVHVGVEIETQFDSEHEASKQVRKNLSVEAVDERVVAVNHVETEMGY